MATRLKVFVILLSMTALCWFLGACSAAPLFVTPVPDGPSTQPPQADTDAMGLAQSSNVGISEPSSGLIKTNPTPKPVSHLLKDLGPAPALSSLEWVNAEPITLADLRGQVVIIEFWSYG